VSLLPPHLLHNTYQDATLCATMLSLHDFITSSPHRLVALLDSPLMVSELFGP